MCYRWFLVILLAAGLAALSFSVAAQEGPRLHPDRSVGVLSADPGYGERWSTTIFPFGNYTGTLSGKAVFCRTYLRFPVGVPTGAEVYRATLSVHVDDYWPGPGSASISVYPVLVDWSVEGVDWYDPVNWPPLGAPVATTRVTSDGGWFTWEVTGLIREWATGARPNYGLALAAADPDRVTDNWAAARRLTADNPETMPWLSLLLQWPTVVTVPPTLVPTSTPSPPQISPPSPTPFPTPVPVLLPETGRGGTGSAMTWAIVLLGLAVAGWVAGQRRKRAMRE